MNTATLMTLSPQAGAAVKSQTPRMVAKTDASSAGTGNETFGDVLGKAGEEVKKAMAESPAEAQGSVVEPKDAEIDDVSKGTETHSKDGEKRGEGKLQENKPQEIRDTEKKDLDEARMAPAAVMAFSMEGNARLLMDVVPEAEEVSASQNLHSLLPQSATEAEKNKNFLAMLSGQQVKNAGQSVNSNAPLEQVLTQVKPDGQTKPLNTELLFKQFGMEPVQSEGEVKATLLEIQLRNHQAATPGVDRSWQAARAKNVNAMVQEESAEPLLQANPSDGGRDTMLNAKGMALFQQSEATMPSGAVGKVMDQTNVVQVENRNVMPPAMVSQASAKENPLPADVLLGKMEVPVEKAVEMPLPQQNIMVPADNKSIRQESGNGIQSPLADEVMEETAPIAVTAQDTDARQMGSRQEQGARQQTPPQPVPLETVVDDKGQVVQQLSEEAAGDKAGMPSAQEVHNGPVSAFQQDLAESIRETRPPEVQQSRDVQDNFQVARQIIDQARLIRRGENTEMVIKLHPDHLGELTLKVSVSANGAVNASFHSDNAQVRTIIENSLVQLKQELNNQGLKVDNVDVYAGLGEGGLPQGEGQQAWQQNQGHNSRGAGGFTGNGDDYGEDTENMADLQQSERAATDSVDYRV